ncbi:MAG TPA: hypothetical protein VFV50_08555, partial [Bdellovibrionales bacterium]|nr:hypothetical protein [Bdellovibrionales bacterium]
VVLADRDSSRFSIRGLEKALATKTADVRVFGKPTTRKYRRMAVALARAKTVEEARRLAKKAASRITIDYED